MKYMLDTNICIYIIKQKPIEVIKKFSKMKRDDMLAIQYGIIRAEFEKKEKQSEV